jgi:polar amino acid transport system permease protein
LARLTRRQRARVVRAVVLVGPAAVVAFFAARADWARIQRAYLDPEVARDMFPDVMGAARNTLVITLGAFAFGLVLGLVLALMRLSPIRPYRWIAAVYIEVFRGIPALVTLILVGFVLPITLGYRLPSRTATAIVGLGIVAAAYLAETVRAGIQAVPKGQVEAARSLGMSPTRTTISIVLPQAFRIIIPPLTNELVLLIKDSSLVFVLGSTVESRELTQFGRDAVSRTFNGTPVVVIAVLYLALTIPMTRLTAALERRGARAAR